MSLILDALKKSEAERRRGLPPGINTPFSAPRRRSRAPWAAGAGAIVLAAGLAGGWMWMGRSRDQVPPDLASGSSVPAQSNDAVAPSLATSVASAVPMDASPMVSPVSESGASSAAIMEAMGGASGASNGGQVSGGGLPTPSRAGLFTPSATPEPQVADTPPPVAAPVEPTINSVPTPVVAAVPAKPMPVQTLPPPSPDQPTINGVPAMTSPDIPPEIAAQMAQPKPELPQEQILTVHQLAYSLRKDLPKLALSMHVFSPIAAERFVVLNGKRFQIDSPPPGPELNLVDIVSDGVILEFRGQRFLLPRTSY